MERTQSWSKGWTQRGPPTSALRQVRRMRSPLRADSERNSVQDLHAPGLAPLAREVKPSYGTIGNLRASLLIAAYFVGETFRFGLPSDLASHDTCSQSVAGQSSMFCANLSICPDVPTRNWPRSPTSDMAS